MVILRVLKKDFDLIAAGTNYQVETNKIYEQYSNAI